MDPISQFKENQKMAWSTFAVLESLTGTVAPKLVRFAGIAKGAEVLDVACGTGVAALTAARLGARVTGVDLTPELVARAKENAAIMKSMRRSSKATQKRCPLPTRRSTSSSASSGTCSLRAPTS